MNNFKVTKLEWDIKKAEDFFGVKMVENNCKFFKVLKYEDLGKEYIKLEWGNPVNRLNASQGLHYFKKTIHPKFNF